MQLSIIIPTLNEELALGVTLALVTKLDGVSEIVVVDGGSRDDTLKIAASFGAKVICSKRGRGGQMHTGAEAAAGGAFWFLHADTLPPADAVRQIQTALAGADVVGGNFEIRFDGARRAARLLTWLYPKLRLLGLCYGDSAFFVRREVYERVGGFRPLPLFEDVELYQQIRKHGRFVHLKSAVTTSSRRFEQKSFAWTFLRWSLFQGLYWIGVPPEVLARYYAHVRK